jgi:CBS domain-containing protein
VLVETILQTKGIVVHTLPQTANLADAVRLLNQHNIGAVVVTDAANAIVGIISERDIVRRLGADAGATLAMPVGDCMTKGVLTCTRDTMIDDVMERMTRYRIRHMPVTDDRGLVGIVSIGDVVKHKIEAAEREAEVLREYIAS